jgi:hypothetical protein
MIVDREMRELIKEWKATQPFGMRAKAEQQMRDAYELSDPETQQQMKETLREHLGHFNREGPVAIPLYGYGEDGRLLEQGPLNQGWGGDRGYESPSGIDRVQRVPEGDIGFSGSAEESGR